MLSQRSHNCPYFFSFFFSTLFCDSDFHRSVFLLTYSFLCLSYSAVDSLSVFVICCIVHLCCSLNLLVLVKQFFCLLGLCYQLLPETLYHVYYLTLSSLQVDCLSPLHLASVPGFYLFPSPGMCFSVTLLQRPGLAVCASKAAGVRLLLWGLPRWVRPA